ncbi:MAG: hypothetical protein PHT69_01740 [Bacteroidales bacterium]|nr:hypothetical protein [Bacteroidales bacterium]
MLKYLIIWTLIFSVQQDIDRDLVYGALRENNMNAIDLCISKLENKRLVVPENAYLGALYMKKSSFLSIPREKLATFRKGKLILENEIATNPLHVEMKLLRLMIQENSPEILNYYMNIVEDSDFIVQKYSTLNAELKAIIKDYSRTSTALNTELLH